MILTLLAAAALAVETQYAHLADVELRARVLVSSDPLAVDELGHRVQPLRYSLDTPRYWRAVDENAGLCEALLEREGSGFRRWALEELFDSAAGGLISVVDLRPDDRRWVARWKRLDAVLRRGLEHADPEVRESFERYRRRPSLSLDDARSRAEAAHAALINIFPDERPFLERTFFKTRAVDAGFAKVQQRLANRPRAKDHPALLNDIYVAVNERRVIMAWAHVYPRTLAERLGSQALDQTGLKIEPQSRLWPDYGPLTR